MKKLIKKIPTNYKVMFTVIVTIAVVTYAVVKLTTLKDVIKYGRE